MVSFNATPRKCGGLVAPSLAFLLAVSSLPRVSSQKLNEIIVLGSHNSDHVLDTSRPLLQQWTYDHPLVAEQAETYGVRHFEFDIQEYDGADFPVGHIPGYDFNSSCSFLTECVTQLREWSSANPDHLTLFVYLEMLAVPTTTAQWTALDDVLTSVWGDDLLTPAELQGDFGSLREALIVNQAWPNVDDVRGQAIFLVNSPDYLAEVANPSAFQLFDFGTADVEADDNAVFLIIENANNNAMVLSRSTSGYMIRVRADASEEFIFPVPVDADAERIIEDYFAVIDLDNNTAISTTEVVLFVEALTNEPLNAALQGILDNTLVSCSDNATEGFVLAQATCIQQRTGALGSRLPPLPSDFITLEQATTRRDGNLISGAHMLASDHFVPEDADINGGGYVVTLADDCEYYLNPTSSACRSPPDGFPAACRPFDCVGVEVVDAASLNGPNAATTVFVLAFAYIAFV